MFNPLGIEITPQLIAKSRANAAALDVVSGLPALTISGYKRKIQLPISEMIWQGPDDSRILGLLLPTGTVMATKSQQRKLRPANSGIKS
ncbi:hypothetical protein [Streptococcus equi]|uniref:hypothetical protein n=1 Tax=Streptococcus equi TaxID=1336 RepID=UPI0039C5D3CC